MESSMDLWKPVGTVKIRVYKYNPRRDFAPGWKEYEIEVSRGTTILDALLRIKEEMDPSLAFRYSCGQALCGSCAMMVNGRQMLICRTRVLEVAKDGKIELRPLDNFPIIRDLACDFKSFFDKHRAVKPWIIRKDAEELENPTGDYKQTIEEYARYYQFTDCLLCGACYSACPTVSTDHEYLGPHALAQAYRYIIDTRDDGLEERIAVVDSDHGCWRCHFATSCSDVCPKYVDPAQGIQLLKKLIMRSKLGFKPHKPAEVLSSKIGEVKRR